jgi:hypothetical protein
MKPEPPVTRIRCDAATGISEGPRVGFELTKNSFDEVGATRLTGAAAIYRITLSITGIGGSNLP